MCHSNLKFVQRYIVNLFSVVLLSFSYNALALDLRQAEQLAIHADPAIESLKAKSRSHVETSVADASLPDPQLRIGAVNVPVDSFDLEQSHRRDTPAKSEEILFVQRRERHSILSVECATP